MAAAGAAALDESPPLADAPEESLEPEVLGADAAGVLADAPLALVPVLVSEPVDVDAGALVEVLVLPLLVLPAVEAEPLVLDEPLPEVLPVLVDPPALVVEPVSGGGVEPVPSVGVTETTRETLPVFPAESVAV